MQGRNHLFRDGNSHAKIVLELAPLKATLVDEKDSEGNAYWDKAMLREYRKTDEDVANYLTLVLDENDIGELTHALGVVARARGIRVVAEQSGLTREALYKALRPSSQPRFDTIYRVCNALGVRLVAQPGATHV